MSIELRPPPRRLALRQGLCLAGAVALPAWALRANATSPITASGGRELALRNLHTNESIALTYARADGYLASALQALNHFLRDHYSGDVGLIDPRLFELLHRVQDTLGGRNAGRTPFEVISGYRSPATNQHLRQTRGGGVARHSLHMDGRAIDVRLPGVPLAELRDAARSLQAGGVGYYPGEQFVHLDTGSVRAW